MDTERLSEMILKRKRIAKQRGQQIAEKVKREEAQEDGARTMPPIRVKEVKLIYSAFRLFATHCSSLCE